MDNTNSVVEMCAYCEHEIEMRWDVSTQGYKAFCPVCGNRLMLCDECQHRGEDGEHTNDCDYDSRTDTCRFNPAKVQEKVQEDEKQFPEVVERLRKEGYPYKIKGNGGYKAVLVGVQPLNEGNYMAIYRYPGGDCCHDLEEIRRYFTVIEQ